MLIIICSVSLAIIKTVNIDFIEILRWTLYISLPIWLVLGFFDFLKRGKNSRENAYSNPIGKVSVDDNRFVPQLEDIDFLGVIKNFEEEEAADDDDAEVSISDLAGKYESGHSSAINGFDSSGGKKPELAGEEDAFDSAMSGGIGLKDGDGEAFERTGIENNEDESLEADSDPENSLYLVGLLEGSEDVEFPGLPLSRPIFELTDEELKGGEVNYDESEFING